MASSKIKGITVEIGGDTTKLGKAIEDSEKKSKSLQYELKYIDKLLKFDPKNTELLAQKQDALRDAVKATSDQLDTLRKAEKQVQAQFEKGEIGEDQYRSFRREIISTENELKDYEKQLENTTKGLDDLDEKTEKVEKSSSDLGSKLGSIAVGGAKLLAGAVVSIGGAMVGSAEATREYRDDISKLETAFDTAGHSSEVASNTYKELQSIIGETDQAVEASQQIALLASAEEDVAKWADLAGGVVGRFGDALQPETFYESANETIKLGEATGAYVQMLEGTGYSVEKFNEGLAECTTEEEKQAYMLGITEQLLGDASDKFKETNAEVIRANEANESFTASMAEIGESVEPLITDVKLLGAGLLTELLPGITSVTTAFRGMLNGDEGASEELGSALSGLITTALNKLLELAPTIVSVGMSLITTLITTLVSNLPQFLTTGIQIIVSIIDGLVTAIPQIVNAIVMMIPQLATALVTGIPQIIQGAVNLFLAIVQAIPQILPPLIQALPTIIMSIINGLLTAIPQLLQGAITLFLAIVQAIPVLITTLLPLIPTIITNVVNALIECLPMLLDGAVTLFMAMVEANIQVGKELVKSIPPIITAVIKLLVKLPGKIYNAIIGAVNKVSTWGNNMKAKAVSMISNMVSSVISKAKELPGKIYNAVKGAIDKIGTWGTNMKNKAKTAISNVATSIKDGLKNVPNDMLTAGKNIVEGLWKGISNATAWIKQKVGEFAKSILQAMKDKLGIKSPSRVFRDQVGKFIAEGIGVGIGENEDKPIGALNQLTKDMLDTTSNINGVTLNRQLETTFRGNMPTEGSVADLVNLVSDYMPKLIEASKKSIVLDSGTLVGETINQIDARLSKNYTLRARGV